MNFLDQNFKKNPWPYVFQSLCASVYILFILLFLDIRHNAAIIASLGASVFLVFTTPRQYYAHPKPLIGGYLVGILMGVLFSYLAHTVLIETVFAGDIRHVVCGALAVGISIFLMVITDTEHPPAAGMALSLVLGAWNLYTVTFIVTAVIFLSLLKKILNPFLKKLI
ncbi:MAG: HPP family protein [Candidatus Omnitrophica bacterium]|nr:HPP family protein [Candidatus Omnitrophota bacterium]